MGIIIILIGVGILVFVWMQYFKQNKKRKTIRDRYKERLDKDLGKDD